MLRFATEEQMRLVELRVNSPKPEISRSAAVELCWHLRQRDSTRASNIARDLLTCAGGFASDVVNAAATVAATGVTAAIATEVGVALTRTDQARIELVLAEISALLGDLVAAESLRKAAREQFVAEGNLEGQCDADWLGAAIVSDMGAFDQRLTLMQSSRHLAMRMRDYERTSTAELALKCFDVFEDGPRALKTHGRDVARYLAEGAGIAPGIQTLAHCFMSRALSGADRFVEGIEHGLASFRHGEASGQIRRAVTDAADVASSYLDVNEFDAALELLQRALNLARKGAWPQTLGRCLTVSAEALRRMDRLSAATDMADEAMAVLSNYPESKNYMAAVQAAAVTARDTGNLQRARELFSWMAKVDNSSDGADMRRYASFGLAEISAFEGDNLAAAGLATQACALAETEGDAPIQVEALRLLAKVARSLNVPGSPLTLDQPIGYLLKARTVAQACLKMDRSVALLEDLSLEYELQGDLVRALETLKASRSADAVVTSEAATKRVIGFEVRFKTERALADADYQRKMAATESVRATELETLNLQLGEAMAVLEKTQCLLMHRNDELNQAYARISDLSLTDPLTGLRNRRFLTESIEKDVAHCVRQYRESTFRSGDIAPEAVVGDILFFMLDLDHFKQVNDVHGHAAGDAVLVQLKDRLMAATREEDHVIRWGGEEFLIAARGVDRDEGPAMAERLRACIADTAFELANGLKLQKTCSIGFAAFPPDKRFPKAASWQDVVALADQRLYVAKGAGRNRCVGQEDPGQQAEDSADVLKPFPTSRAVPLRSLHSAP